MITYQPGRGFDATGVPLLTPERRPARQAITVYKPVTPKMTSTEVAEVVQGELMPMRSGGEIEPVTLRPAKKTIDEIFEGGSAQLADLVRKVVTYYSRLPSEADEILTTLWAMGTHWRTSAGKLAFRVYPLAVAVAEPGAGKTRWLEILQALSYNPSGIEQEPTEFGLKKMTNQQQTILLDELQDLLGLNGTAARRIRSILLAYKMGASSTNARGGGKNAEDLYTPKALAGTTELLTHTNGNLRALFTRALPLVEMVKSHDTIPDQDNAWDIITTGFNRHLTQLGAEWTPEATDENPNPTLWPIHDVPGELDSRQLELAKTYFAIADRLRDPRVVEKTGHDTRWAEMARDAVITKVRGEGDSGEVIAKNVLDRMTAMGMM